ASPCSSVTLPVSVPLVPWAKPGAVANATTRRATPNLPNRLIKRPPYVRINGGVAPPSIRRLSDAGDENAAALDSKRLLDGPILQSRSQVLDRSKVLKDLGCLFRSERDATTDWISGSRGRRRGAPA